MAQGYNGAAGPRYHRACSRSSSGRGVIFGFENMGDNPARANAVLAAERATTASGAGPMDPRRAEEAADELTRVAAPDAGPSVDGPAPA